MLCRLIEIIPVKWIDQVLEKALERAPLALCESAEAPAVAATGENSTEVVKH